MRPSPVSGPRLTRRQFVQTGGALFVGFSLVGTDFWKARVQAAVDTNTLDPARPESWVEIRADGTIVIRTGKTDFGQSSVTTAYKQIVAEELHAPFEAVTTVVMGDTDRTPDGGGAFAFLATGADNLRKAAAYTREAPPRPRRRAAQRAEEPAFDRRWHRVGRRDAGLLR